MPETVQSAVSAEAWHVVPGAAEQLKLKERLLRALDETGDRRTKAIALLELLFTESVKAAQQTPPAPMQPLPLDVIAQRLQEPKSLVSQVRARLNPRLSELFDSGPCYDEQYRVRISKGRLALQFARTLDDAATPVSAFWRPYLQSRRLVVAYPEPQFFKDGNDTYYRNHTINHDDPAEARNRFFGRGQPERDLEPSQSFVPSGFVTALIQLFEAFSNTGRMQVTATKLRFTETIPDIRDNVVLLGTSSSVREIANMTSVFPMRSERDADGRNAVVVRSEGRETAYLDDNHNPDQDSSTLLTKWVVVTRRYNGNQCNTVFAGHSRAVEAAVKVLTDHPSVRLDGASFAAAFHPLPPFGPREFQLLLGTQMDWRRGDLNIRRIFIQAVSDSTHARWVTSQLHAAADRSRRRTSNTTRRRTTSSSNEGGRKR